MQFNVAPLQMNSIQIQIFALPFDTLISLQYIVNLLDGGQSKNIENSIHTNTSIRTLFPLAYGLAIRLDYGKFKICGSFIHRRQREMCFITKLQFYLQSIFNEA